MKIIRIIKSKEELDALYLKQNKYLITDEVILDFELRTKFDIVCRDTKDFSINFNTNHNLECGNFNG